MLGSFENHNGYNGAFLGKPNENWHLEFTQSDVKANPTFDDDDILVFYPNTKIELEVIKENLKLHTIEFIKATNPYWNDPEVSGGIIFLDPDGFRIVISHLKIV